MRIHTTSSSSSNAVAAALSAVAGLKFGQVIAVILIILKALDKIDISWFVALSSFIWVPVAIFVVVVTAILVGLGIVTVFGLIIERL
jgi:hypothetical protein